MGTIIEIAAIVLLTGLTIYFWMPQIDWNLALYNGWYFFNRILVIVAVTILALMILAGLIEVIRDFKHIR